MNKAILASILVLVFGVPTASAETVYLKDGKIVRGKIIQEDETAVMVESADSWQKIEKSAIELIRADNGRSVPIAPSAVQPASAAPHAPAPQERTPPAARRQGAGFYLGLQIPYNMIGGNFDGSNMPNVDPGFGFGFIAGYNFDLSFAIELDLVGSSHTSAGADTAFGEFSLNLKYNMRTNLSEPSPFLFTGIGSFTYGDDNLTYGGTGYNLGFGIDIPTSEKNSFGFALIWKFITYDEIVGKDTPLGKEIKGDTLSVRFDFTHRF